MKGNIQLKCCSKNIYFIDKFTQQNKTKEQIKAQQTKSTFNYKKNTDFQIAHSKIVVWKINKKSDPLKRKGERDGI